MGRCNIWRDHYKSLVSDDEVITLSEAFDDITNIHSVLFRDPFWTNGL